MPAPELFLGQEHQRPYGIRQQGLVVTDNFQTPITFRRPTAEIDSVYIFANGWTGSRNSMRLPAHEAVEAGYGAVTFSYTNTGSAEALAENAREMAAVIDALPADLERRAMGLSMGGWVTAKALQRVETPVQAVTFIASAGFMSRIPSKLEVLQHLSAEYPELAAHYLKDPVGVAKLGFSSAKNIVQRLRAVGAEIGELTHGSAHDIIHTIKAAPDAPTMHFAYGDRDKLIPAYAQEEGIIGLPFDRTWKYPGGHVEAVFNRTLLRHLFELDSRIPSDDPVSIAA